MNTPELSIILPCYNESRNIPLIIERVRKFWPEYNFELILVNNGSSDGSELVLDEEAKKPENAFLRVVTVKKNIGYGHGIYTGLKAAQAPVLAYSHADIQTPPEDVFKAYRFVQENGIDLDKTLIKGKRINRSEDAQFLTNSLAKVVEIVLGHKLDDINGQPKLFSRTLLNNLTHPPTDFSFDVYLMYIARVHEMEVLDFPVDFGVRVHGESKWASNILSRYKTIWSYLVSIFEMGRNHYSAPGNLLGQLVRFFSTGVLTNVVNYTSFLTLLRLLKVNYLISSATAFIAGFLVGFVVNRNWTFNASDGDSKPQLVRFLTVNTGSLGANMATIWFCTEKLGIIPEISQIIAIAVSAIINFSGSKFWAFKK